MALKDYYDSDLSRESREISRGRGSTVFEELGDVPSGSFDLVFTRHTLEHVPYPPRYLEDARQFAPSAPNVVFPNLKGLD
jgi:hypothetical protein